MDEPQEQTTPTSTSTPSHQRKPTRTFSIVSPRDQGVKVILGLM